MLNSRPAAPFNAHGRRTIRSDALTNSNNARRRKRNRHSSLRIVLEIRAISKKAWFLFTTSIFWRSTLTGKLRYKQVYELSARRLAVGTRTNSHDEVCRRLIGRVGDAVLFIRTHHRQGPSVKAMSFSLNRDFHCAFAN